MKKTLFVLLALLLCASMLFTSCEFFRGDDDKEDDKKEETVKSEVNKQTVIQDFNKIDLYKLYETVKDGVEQSVDVEELKKFDFRTIEQQISGEITLDKNSANVSAELKDGMIHAVFEDTTPGATAKDEYYVYISDAFQFISFYLDADGKWVTNYKTPTAPDEVVSGEASQQSLLTEDSAPETPFDALLNFDFEILKRIVIPAISEEQLTEKDGKLVLDNSYFADLFVANYDLLLELLGSEGAPTKEEFRTEVEEMIGNLGIEIAFNANDKTITAVYITIAPANDDTRFGFEIELSDDAKALERAKVFVMTRGSLDVDYDTGISVELRNTFDKGDLTAVALDIVLHTMSYDARSTEPTDNGSIITSTIVCSKIEADLKLTGISAGEVPEISAVVTGDADKVFKVVETRNYSTGTENVTVEELSKDGYGEKFDAKLIITGNVEEKKCDIDLVVNMGETKFVARGSWLFTEAPAFPTLPSEITEFINSFEGQ